MKPKHCGRLSCCYKGDLHTHQGACSGTTHRPTVLKSELEHISQDTLPPFSSTMQWLITTSIEREKGSTQIQAGTSSDGHDKATPRATVKTPKFRCGSSLKLQPARQKQPKDGEQQGAAAVAGRAQGRHSCHRQTWRSVLDMLEGEAEPSTCMCDRSTSCG
jgi:hypothetical protein